MFRRCCSWAPAKTSRGERICPTSHIHVGKRRLPIPPAVLVLLTGYHDRKCTIRYHLPLRYHLFHYFSCPCTMAATKKAWIMSAAQLVLPFRTKNSSFSSVTSSLGTPDYQPILPESQRKQHLEFQPIQRQRRPLTTITSCSTNVHPQSRAPHKQLELFSLSFSSLSASQKQQLWHDLVYETRRYLDLMKRQQQQQQQLLQEQKMKSEQIADPAGVVTVVVDLRQVQVLLQRWYEYLLPTTSGTTSKEENPWNIITATGDGTGAMQELLYSLYTSWLILLKQEQINLVGQPSSLPLRRTSSSTTSSSLSLVYPLSTSMSRESARTTFEQLLYVYSHLAPQGTYALSILNDWLDVLGGDLSCTPNRDHYHAVLRAYANTIDRYNDRSNNLEKENEIQHIQIPSLSNSTMDNSDPLKTTAMALEATAAYRVAMEIYQSLHASYDMKPTVETLYWILQCLWTICRDDVDVRRNDNLHSYDDVDHRGTGQNSNNNDNNSTTVRLVRTAPLHQELAKDWQRILQYIILIRPLQLDHRVVNWTDNNSKEVVQPADPQFQNTGYLYRSILTAAQIGFWIQQQEQKHVSLDSNQGMLSVSFGASIDTCFLPLWATSIADPRALRELVKNWNSYQDFQFSGVHKYQSIHKHNLVDELSPSITAFLELCLFRTRCDLAGGSSSSSLASQHSSSLFIDLAQATIQSLEVVFAETKLLPTSRHYLTCIKALVEARQDPSSLVENLESHVHVSDRSFLSDLASMESITESWNDLLRAYQLLMQTDRIRQTWNVMQRSKHIHLNQDSYLIFLQCLASTAFIPDAERAHATLRRLRTSPRPHIRLTSDHYLWVMQAWANIKDPRASHRCQQIMDWLLEDAASAEAAETADSNSVRREQWGLQPNDEHYRTLITAWGWSYAEPEAPNVIVRLFEKLGSMSGQTPGTAATMGSDNGVNLSNSRSNYASKEQLDVAVLAAVLTALSRVQSPEAALRAQEILNGIEHQSHSTHIFPDRTCYNAVLYTWAHSDAVDALSRSEHVLRQLEAAFVNSGYNPALRPDSATYRAIIQAHVRHGGEEEDCRGIDSNTAISPGALAEAQLRRMEVAATNKMADPPDRKVYTAVLTAYSLSSRDHRNGNGDGTPQEALKIWNQMMDSYQAGNLAAKPDAMAFSYLLQAWARSYHPQKASIAFKLLQEMCRSYKEGDVDMEPIPAVFNWVLNACDFTRINPSMLDFHIQKDQIVTVALNTLDLMDQLCPGGGCNEQAYRSMFQVLHRHVSDERRRTTIGKHILHLCSQAGFVSREIVLILQQYLPTIAQLLPTEESVSGRSVIQIPPRWRRNVSGGQ